MSTRLSWCIRAAAVRGALVALVAGITFGVSACGGGKPPALPSSLSSAAPLLDSIGKAVPGLSQEQSILGAGSLLGLAKGKMPADQFSKVADALPGSNELINQASKKGLPKETKGLTDVSQFLGKSGISPTQINQMMPVLTNAVSDKAGPDIASAFSSVLR